MKARKTDDGYLAAATPAADKAHSPQKSSWQQYAAAFGTFVAVSFLNLWLERWIGYQSIPLIYLLEVVVLALFVSRGPLLFGTALTAIGWIFLFVPPKYSLHIGEFYDKMMFATYLWSH